MNIKLTILLSLFLAYFQITLKAQEMRLSLEVESGHLLSEWQINDSIKARVMLETGFPKVVISEAYALQHLQGMLKMEKAPENTNISLWGNKSMTKVSYIINDSLMINGRKLMLDALVVDFSSQKSWKHRDVIFPLRDLPGKTEINIKEEYMIIDKNTKKLSLDYVEYNMKFDDGVKGLYLVTTLQIFDTLKTKEELSGNFLLDLGAPNAIFVNRNLNEVETFVNLADRMVLKDTTKFKPNKHTNLAIIIPEKIQLDNIFITGEYVVAMKLFGARSEKYVGIIGNHFFTKFVVLFDFRNNKVYLKPNSDKVEIVE